MVVEMRKTGMVLAGVIAFWAASQAFIGWQTLAAVRDMKAALPDTVKVTKTDTIHDCGRSDVRNSQSPF
jgi:hypothetical protein